VDVLVIVDMQEGLRNGSPKHELDAVVDRINRLAHRVRARGGRVIFVQHAGPAGDDFARGSNGWQFLPELERAARDRVVEKTLNDPFFGTTLDAELATLNPSRVLVAGWATDFCVDATVRSAAARGFCVVVVADGHTVSDRPHLTAQEVITHHHWIWTNLISAQPVTLLRETEI
jgi:nicotinamidase-related amidase